MVTSAGRSRLRREPVRTLFEALLVGLTGFGLALAANYLSPRGLSLGRDYFPQVIPATATGAVARPVPGPSGEFGATNAPVGSALRARLEARGLRLAETPEVRRLYEDPRRMQELIVFVDARNDEYYQEGHVPGAYQFDHYYPAQYLPSVLAACQQAELIVVYCTGGDCEDSEFASQALHEAGVPLERILVYGGGLTEWKTSGMPVEVGARGSGDLRSDTP